MKLTKNYLRKLIKEVMDSENWMDPKHYQDNKEEENKLPSGAKKISLYDVFSNKDANIIRNAGYKFIEKPSYWEEIDNMRRIPMSKLKSLLPDIKSIHSNQIWKGVFDEKQLNGPSKGVNPNFDYPKVFIIIFGSSGNCYVVEKSANAYIRFWLRIGE